MNEAIYFNRILKQSAFGVYIISKPRKHTFWPGHWNDIEQIILFQRI